MRRWLRQTNPVHTMYSNMPSKIVFKEDEKDGGDSKKCDESYSSYIYMLGVKIMNYDNS